jgi:hypothetical protein
MGEFQIRPVESAEQAQAARVILSEYAQWLAHHLCWADFQCELDGLPSQYTRPGGGSFWLGKTSGWRVASRCAGWTRTPVK